MPGITARQDEGRRLHGGRPRSSLCSLGRTAIVRAASIALVLCATAHAPHVVAQPAPAARPPVAAAPARNVPAAGAGDTQGGPAAAVSTRAAPSPPVVPGTAAAATPRTGKDRVPNPVDGAFGIRFDSVLPRHVRGGTIPGIPLPLPASVGAAAVETRPGVQQLWMPVRPPTIPQLLVALRPQPLHAVLLDDAEVPVRILTEARTPGCQSLFVALGKRLAERYGAAVDTPRPPGVEHY